MAEYQPWQHRIEDGEHKYARFFLEDGHQVFWLANFVNLNRFVRGREDDTAYVELWRRGVEQPLPRLRTFTPFAWLPYVKAPVLGSEWVGRRFMRYTQPSLERVLAHSEFDDVDVLWIGNQRMLSIVPLVKHRALVYRMKDDVEQYGSEPPSIGRIERLICERADLVFATAQQLVVKAQRYTERVHYLPNGVDFDLFRAPDLEIPEDLRAIPSPRLTYVGQISHWFDFDAVRVAAQRLEGCSFVLIGPTALDKQGHTHLEQLGALPNVYVLGSRPFVQVRAYMRHSHVGLIPFLQTPLTHAINPIKLFEYCSAGLPVVSTRLEETERLHSPALLHETPSEWITNLETALEKGDTLGAEGVEFAKHNSWRCRYEEIRERLQSLFRLQAR
jgi:glycosyltransferase involved in cell wall biosynthesis